MVNKFFYFLRFLIGILNPWWVPPAPKGETPRQTVTLYYYILSLHPGVRKIISVVSWGLLIYTIF